MQQVGELKEYIGCKLDRTNDSIKITQPVLMQSYTDEFDLSDERKAPVTPAEPLVLMLKKQEGEKPLGPDKQKTYWSGVGKLLHMMKKSECGAGIVEVHDGSNYAAHARNETNYGILCGDAGARMATETRSEVGWEPRLQVSADGPIGLELPYRYRDATKHQRMEYIFGGRACVGEKQATRNSCAICYRSRDNRGSMLCPRLGVWNECAAINWLAS